VITSLNRDASALWGAHAFRVLVSVFHRNNLFRMRFRLKKKFAAVRMQSPTRRGRAPLGARICAFTVIELLIVMAIILVLAGLILATSSYVQKKGARSRAEAEIAAISAALENYKADNGIYPRSSATDTLNAQAHTSPDALPHPNLYDDSSKALYGFLSGDNGNFNNVIDTPAEQANKGYFSFKPQMLGGTRDAAGNLTAVISIRDPFGNSFGYSTLKASSPTATGGYNPTFDLWSTGGETGAGKEASWIKNW